ncbi:MAG: hypothetical protein SFW36_11400 [Leptolyngbyaceae cyanobacterium bins.59]|nr:hypothetical protein [Leptolyngbyaceae cyanobacterium bins.59]
MSNFILLRDIPKQTVQIDLWRYEVQGGFRGFQSVPSGIHYVEIQAGELQANFWVAVSGNEVVIRMFDYQQQQFINDTPESEAHYQELALSGAMGKALIAYPNAEWLAWWQLTRHIPIAPELPQLHHESPMQPPLDLSPADLGDWMQQKYLSRFEQALLTTHQGNTAAFLAEFQFAFVRWLVSTEGVEDQEAFRRWQHLLLASYGAGETTIAHYPELFCDLVDTLLAQSNYLPDVLLTPDSFVCSTASHLAEDMIDTDIEALVAQGKRLADWLDQTIVETP